MSPKELVQKWVDAFNGGNADNIAEFYAENAINHQVVDKPVAGKTSENRIYGLQASC